MALLFGSMSLLAQQNVSVSVQSNFYSPESVTISVGDTVTWSNLGGFHNVNGDQSVYPDNPESFGNGPSSASSWTFQYVFDLPGTYTYQCDPHAGLGMVGTVVVEAAPAGNPSLLLTAVFDGPLPGGLPKGVELYATADIPDLSLYGVGSATNGGGTDGEEFTFPAVAVSAGDFLYLTQGDGTEFAAFFGFEPDFADDMNDAVNINGDDAIELFFNGSVVDVFGEIDTDGTGQPWEYQDGWAYRVDGTGPDGTTFVLSNWTFSGPNALDNEADNASAAVPVPVGTYTPGGTAVITANNDVVSTDFETAVNFTPLANDQVPGTLQSFTLATTPDAGTAVIEADNSVTYTPDAGFCGEDSFEYEICDEAGCATATVTINVMCPIDYPTYTIGEVTTTDMEGVADSVGTICALQGTVYGVNLRPGGGLQFTIIDDAGDGIGVFSGIQDFGYTVNEGDIVMVEGEIDQFNGLLQIIADNVALVSSGNPLIAPTVITELSEATESQLVTIQDVTLVDPAQWAPGGSGFNVDVTDGVSTITVRIDNDVELFDMAVPTGTFNVTGIGGQFDNSAPFLEGYQLLPRYAADIDPYNMGGGTDYPAYPVGTVTSVDANGVADSLGIACTLQGVAYGVNLRSSGLQFTLIDENNDGVGVFSASEDFGYAVTEGDELIIRGTIDQFNGLTQIVPDELEVVSTGNPLFSPTAVTALGEETESQLISPSLELSLVDPAAWDQSGGSFNVEATDGTNIYLIRVDNSTTLAGTSGPGLNTFRITGIGGQFDSSEPFDEGYQIFPRYLEDLDIISSTQDETLGAAITIFPNPVAGALTIQLQEDLDQVRVFNAQGQQVWAAETMARTLQLNTAQWASGLYTVTFLKGERTWSEQLIVK